jgi:hypothetical protein
MSKDLVSWEPRRLPRRQTKEWLEDKGPLAVEQILHQVSMWVSGITIDDVEQELVEHPRLFHLREDGLWEAAPAETYSIKPRTRPRLRPAQSKPDAGNKRKATSSKTEATAPCEPPSPEPFFVDDSGRLVSIILRRDVPADGQIHETGRLLVVPVPQEAEAGQNVRDAIMAACGGADEVQVYERTLDSRHVYRGLRRIVQASMAPSGGRVSLVFGGAVDIDDGRLRSLKSQKELVAFHSGSTLAMVLASPREAILGIVHIPEQLKRLITIAAPRQRFDRKSALKAATKRLLDLRLGQLTWEQFQDWLIKRKPEYDRELMEQVLTLALQSPGADPTAVMVLAQLVLDGPEPETQQLARAFAIALSKINDRVVADWAARLLPKALEDATEDRELREAAALISCNRGDYETSCHWFEGIAEDPTSPLSPESLTCYLLAAQDVRGRSRRRIAQRALDQADRILDSRETPIKLDAYRDALQWACELEGTLGAIAPRRIEQILHLLAEFDERAAMAEYQARCKDAKIGDQLIFLSVLETCELPDILSQTYGILVDLVDRSLRQTQNDLIQDAINQLRIVEVVVAEKADASRRFQTSLDARIAKISNGAPIRRSSPKQVLNGKIVTLVGGRKSTRSRVASMLIDEGASVREVPPNWEKRVDTGSVRSKVAGADLVATITDCVKHDASAILKNLRHSLTFIPVQTAGGPSRIFRDITAAAA